MPGRPARLRQPDYRIYVGAGGSGKSVLWRHQCRTARRLLVWDPEAENGGKTARAVSSARDLVAAVRAPAFRVAYQPAADPYDAFEFLNRVALAAGSLTLVWEEAHMVMSAQRVPDFAKRIATAGRHSGIRLRVISQVPVAIPLIVRFNATRIMAFRFDEPRQIKYLRDRIGPIADSIPALKPYSAVDWSPKDGRVRASPFA